MNTEKIQLVLARIEILKLKANEHDWQCYVPSDVKAELENMLVEIDKLLKPRDPGDSKGEL